VAIGHASLNGGAAACNKRAMAEAIDLIYGVHPVMAALANPRRKPVKLQVTLNAADRLKALPHDPAVTPEIVAPRELDRRLGSDAVHQGMLLEAMPLTQPRLDQIPPQGPVLVLDQVTDPHNVGAIMRSCAAFAVTALVTTARHSPEASGVLFKAASGGFEHVPYVKVTNLARALEELASYGFLVIGLDSEAPDSLADTKSDRPLALVLGAEGKGLRQLTRATCEKMTRLPLPGNLVSLNVSNAAAVALYEISRRRSS
jgi:23S rRNA (guanosine2251-2'-O)-methyltransferase